MAFLGHPGIRLQFGFSYLPWHTAFFVSVLECTRLCRWLACGQLSWYPATPQLFAPARREQETTAPFSSNPSTDPYKIWCSSTLPLSMYPSPLPSYQLSKSPSIIFPHPFSTGWTQTGCFTSRALRGGRRLPPFCWEGFQEIFWTCSASKVRKTISPGFFGEVRSMHFVRPPDLPKRARCSIAALCHLLHGRVPLFPWEGYREQFYVQPWISTGGGKGSAVRFGKAWLTPSMVMVSKDRIWVPPPPPSLSPAAAQRFLRIPGRLLPQKETSGPIKWQPSKLQENAAQCVYFSVKYLCVFLLPCHRQSYALWRRKRLLAISNRPDLNGYTCSMANIRTIHLLCNKKFS